MTYNNPRFRIHGGAAPFRASVETGKDHRVFSNGKWHELPRAPELPEFLDGPLMDLRSPIRQHVFGEDLARKRRGLSGKRLFGSGDFTRHAARGIAARLDRKQRTPIRAIEQINKSLLAGLGNRIHVFAVVLDRHQNRVAKENPGPRCRA